MRAGKLPLAAGIRHGVTAYGGRRHFIAGCDQFLAENGKILRRSTPIRTMPGAMRTTVMEILSPIRIFSPDFRDKTSIAAGAA